MARGQLASSAASSLGGGGSNRGGFSAGSSGYDVYQSTLKAIREQRKFNKTASKDADKALANQEKQRKKEQKSAEKERLLEMAQARQAAKESRKTFSDIITDWTTAWKEQKKEQLETAIASGASMGEKLKAAGGLLVANMASAVSNLAISGINNAMSSVEENLDLYTKYMTEIEARIQGAYSNMSYASINDLISSNVAGNPFVRYEDVMDNVAKFVGEGIASNLTQRAFLATISDKIATTFDAFDASLLRLVRIQHQDTTAARLGMEAELTKLFNYYFSDTSYLSKAFDDVASAMVDLSSQLSGSTAVEVEYQVQKWLGSMGASGVDDSTLSSIASAINALGSGGVEYLNSNSEMRNLLVLSMNRAGMDFGELLMDGISSLDVNSLLYNMILYIKDTVSGQNNVVKAKYAELFGLSMADIAAIESMETDTVSSLYQQAMTYNDTIVSLNQQIAKIPERMHFSTMVDNVMSNIMASTGMNIANNQGAYMTYKIADMVESLTGGIGIPTISIMGNHIQLPNSIEEYMKIGVAGYGLISSLGDALNNWVSGSMLNIDKWTGSWDKATSYSGFVSTNQLDTSTSSSGFVSNSDSTGMQQSIVDEQSEQAEEVTGKEEDSDTEVIVILRELKDYFVGGKSATTPLRVSMIQSKSTSDSKTEGGSTVETENGEVDLVTVANEILSRVTTMGTIESPVRVNFDSYPSYPQSPTEPFGT